MIKPPQKKWKILESAQNHAAIQAKTQVRFVVEDSDWEIDKEAINRHVHSPSQLSNVVTKKRPPKQMLKTKSISISSKSVSKSKDQQASLSAGPSKRFSPERPVRAPPPRAVGKKVQVNRLEHRHQPYFKVPSEAHMGQHPKMP